MWAGDGDTGGGGSLLDDLEAFGAPAELIAAQRAEAERQSELGILEENRTAVAVFFAAGTQWRYAGMGQPIGLDLAGVEAAARAHETEWTADLLRRIRIMERQALEVWRANRD